MKTFVRTAALTLTLAAIAAVSAGEEATCTATFTDASDADQLLVRGISPWYVHLFRGAGEITDGYYKLTNGIRVTRRQAIGEKIHLAAEFRVVPAQTLHVMVGVVDFRGVETFLVNRNTGAHWQIGKGRMVRAMGTTIHELDTAKMEQWRRFEADWTDGMMTVKMDGEKVGERKVKLFPGEGLGLAFFVWGAKGVTPELHIRKYTLTADGENAEIKSRVMPRDRFVTPRYPFEPIDPNGPMIRPDRKYEPCEPPAEGDEPVKVYDLSDRQIVGKAQDLRNAALRWRHTGDENCLRAFLRGVALFQAVQHDDGGVLSSGWIDGQKYSMWKIALPLIEAYEATEDPRLKAVIDGIAEWNMKAHISGNMNFNTQPAVLGRWYEVTGEKKYLDRGWQIIKSGIISRQEPCGGWAGHNSQIWYTGIGLRVMLHYALSMPEDYEHRDQVLGSIRGGLNQAILSQAANGGMYESWDRLENEKNVWLERIHPKPSVFDPRAFTMACELFGYEEPLVNACWGLMRWLHENHNFTYYREQLPIEQKAEPLPPMPGDTSKHPLPAATTTPPAEEKSARAAK